MFEHLDPAAIVALYDKLYVGIYILDSEGTILFVNDTMVTMTGIPRDKMIGYSIFTRRNFQPSATELVQHKKQTVSLYQTIKAQERTYRQLITSIPVFDEHGEIKYIIAVNEELSSLTRRMGSAAALDQSREGLEPGRDIQSACPLGPVDLVAGQGDQVRAQGLRLEGHLQKALDGIGMENGVRAEPVGELCHLGNGHHGAYLVVYHHNRYKDGVLS